MALYKLGILGAFRNKVGNVVGRIWRPGKYVIAAMPSRYRDANTTEQQIIRVRFKCLGTLAAAFLSAITPGLKSVFSRRKSTAVAEFVRLNWDAVTATTVDSVSVDYADLIIAQGPLTSVQFGAPNFDTPNTVTVGYATNEEVENTDLTDKVYAFVYCPDAKCGVMSAPVARSIKTISVTVPAYWNGMKVHIWGFTVGNGANNKGKISNSDYIGTGNIG